jgi:hypothetical protein
MILFDGSNRDECEVERPDTNTPLQALAMMNDPTVLEASRVLATNLLQQKQPAKEKLEQAFRIIISRKPDEKESAILYNYYHSQIEMLRKDPELVEKLLDVGEYPATDGLDKPALAAIMQVIQTIYNLEEAITRS